MPELGRHPRTRVGARLRAGAINLLSRERKSVIPSIRVEFALAADRAGGPRDLAPSIGPGDVYVNILKYEESDDLLR